MAKRIVFGFFVGLVLLSARYPLRAELFRCEDYGCLPRILCTGEHVEGEGLCMFKCYHLGGGYMHVQCPIQKPGLPGR